MGLADFGAGSKIAKRFVSAGFASGGVWALPSLVDKKWPPKVCKTFLRQKNGAKCSLRHVLDHFWRTVFGGSFSCGAERVFGPLPKGPTDTKNSIDSKFTKKLSITNSVSARGLWRVLIYYLADKF